MRNRMLASAAVFSVLSICAYAVWLRVEGARMSRATGWRSLTRFSDQPVPGAMAQLVARLVRNEKVGGSNPPSSTT